MNRQQWPADLRAQAKALYLSDGATLASSVTGVPQRTVQHWAVTEGWKAQPDKASPQRPDLRLAPVPGTQQPPAKSQAASAGYGYQRRALLRQLGETASLALAQVERELGQGHTVKARDCAIICGIALDKAELLAHAVGPDADGSRPDGAEVVTRLKQVLADLQARRTGSDA